MSGTDGDVLEPILEVQQVTKRFGAVVVLTGVDLCLNRGEVLGLVGDNGAGKSTLVKILTGFQRPDSGRMLFEGKEVSFASVQDARNAGIETVFQDLALVPQLPVYQNLFLNRELTMGGRLGFLNKRKMRELARQYLDDIRVNIPDINAEVEMLSGGQRQAIAVARASRMLSAKVLLLDEPLAAMGAKEAALIIDLVKDLSANRGVSVIVVDHNYTHIFELCDRINVIQQGVVTFNRSVASTSLEELTDFMVAEYRKQVSTGRAERAG
jgi:simple sugar transport system ATP-binding protein